MNVQLIAEFRGMKTPFQAGILAAGTELQIAITEYIFDARLVMPF